MYGKLIEITRNDDYTTGNLLDYFYHQKYYELIDIDLSRQANSSIPQKINFIGKLEENDGATTVPNFSLDSLIVTEQNNAGPSKYIKFVE